VKTKDLLQIAVLPGDGIGQEVIDAAIPVFKALNVPVELKFGDIGWSFWQTEGEPIPARTWQLIKEADTVLLGAITSKPAREAKNELTANLQKNSPDYLSPIIQLRQQLELFANVRPCYSLLERENPFNFCIIRENTEGLYAGFDFHPSPPELKTLLEQNARWKNVAMDDLSCTLRLQSLHGMQRLFNYAFDYASKNNMKRVSFADKPNVLRQSSAFAREIFEGIAASYPTIEADILNVDALALWLIRRPEDFGVIVAENMFGDILSDVGAGVMGGLGVAPSANIGLNRAYFEPVHGSGPRLQKNTANPSAMFLTISMLLDYFDYYEQAHTIRKAVKNALNCGQSLTYDLGGKASTQDLATTIIELCLTQKVPIALQKGFPMNTPNSIEITPEQIKQLHLFSSSELSDALDALGIEGAILGIKPLTPGRKLVGPAYTVQFEPYATKPSHFKQAANYIDVVPENSVIFIDNQGRTDCTAWGDILTTMALQKKIAGTVVYGAVRDADKLQNTKYPIFCTAIYMRSGKNRIFKASEQKPLIIDSITINPGDIIFADDCGVLVLPRFHVAEILIKAEQVKTTEQNIVRAIQTGSSLEQARLDFHYDQPWKN